jgi:hypothetical protein
MGNIEKNNIPSNKEKGKNKPNSSFENIKKAIDKVKQAEDTEQKKDEKLLNVLEQELQASESHT